MREYEWTVPSALSGEALVRITRGSESDTSVAPFAIIDRPQNISLEWACPDSARIRWDSVQGAQAYEVYMLGNEYMDSVGTTTDTSITLQPFDPFVDRWVSVSAVAPPGTEGRRANAVQVSEHDVLDCPQDTNLALELLNPVNSAYPVCVGDKLPVKVRVKNPGKDSVLAFDCLYEFGGNQFSLNYSDTLAPDSSVTFIFSDSIPLSAGVGVHGLEAWVEHSGDNEPFSDTGKADLDFVNTTSFPLHYSENFEDLDECVGGHFECDMSCVLGNGLTNQSNSQVDDIDWRIDWKETYSSGTGPSKDADPGTLHGQYAYLEASECQEQEGGLLTPCLDIDGVNPELHFSYHMSGNSMGELHVDVLVDGEWHMDVMPVIIGDQGDQWQTQSVDLSSFQGEKMVVRFRGITGDDYQSDIALDGIRVIDQGMAPEVKFNGTPRNVCPNRVVILNSLTVGNVNEREWRVQPQTFDFVNGTDSSSQNPNLYFSDEGSYEVELWASNANGADSLTETAYITVGTRSTAPLAEDFEADAYPPVAWQVDDSGGRTTWEQVRNVPGPDGGMTRASIMENFGFDDPGAEEILQTEIIDISEVEGPELTFDVAYNSYSSARSERLKVQVSATCENSFNSVYEKEGDDLVTTFFSSTNYWTPNDADDWREESVDLSGYQTSEELRIRFVNVNGNGNNLYIDNVNIGDPTSLEEEGKERASMELFPNPVSDRLIVKGESIKASSVEFRILDMRGRVLRSSGRELSRGSYRESFDLSGVQEGIYYLERIDPDGGVRTEKFVVQH